ncbi:MAG: aldo/keto reductase family oxidoreductase [Acutalibacteraceae bacterium]
MKKINLSENINSSAVVMGCMRIGNKSVNEVEKLVFTALENGINFFDHADIYANGESERLFGEVLKLHSDLREKIYIQSKCGIRQGMYDFSKEHIISSVEQSLKRLNTDYLDTLLLHRPDALCEPSEVAQAFDELYKSGKVRNFGVSNQNPYQIMLLQKYISQPIIINQLQFSIMSSGMIDSGFNVNMTNPESVSHDGNILDFCRLKDITIQAWSPFQYGFFEGVFIDNPKFPELNKTLDEIAKKYEVSSSAIALAWILRHPSDMQVITGTTNIDRLTDICKGADIKLTREEWYRIYLSSGKKLP